MQRVRVSPQLSRKIDLRVLPILTLFYLMSFLDRTSEFALVAANETSAMPAWPVWRPRWTWPATNTTSPSASSL